MKVRYPCDLHVHSHYSPDADQSPERLFSRAKKLGLKALVITDHNTTAHFEACQRAAAKHGIATLEGIEISTRFEGREIHILGYSKKFKRKLIEKGLAQTIKRLDQRARLMIERLQKLHIAKLDYHTLLRHKFGGYLGRNQIAQAIVRQKKIPYAEAFKFIDWQNGPAYVPYPNGTITPEVAVRLITASSGVAVLAHPAHFMKRIGIVSAQRALLHLLPKLREYGLIGFELNHIDTSEVLGSRKILVQLEKKFSLVATGGSDWHNTLYTGHYDLGHWGCSQKTFSEIKKRAVQAVA